MLLVEMVGSDGGGGVVAVRLQSLVAAVGLVVAAAEAAVGHRGHWGLSWRAPAGARARWW